MTHFRVITALTLATSLLLSLIILTPAPTLAAEAIVTNCTQAGLTQAIYDAATTDPNNPGLVTFNCPNTTIILTTQIFIGDDLLPPFAVTIDGSNNGNPITLDGQSSTRLFFVNDDGYLTIKKMTLQNGRFDIGYGGAIYNEGTLEISQSTLTNNQSGIYGGAIYSEKSLEVIQSAFINNRTLYGGAILNVGNVEITQSSFIDNHAYTRAGALYAYAGKFDISSSTFSDNTAPTGSTIYFDIATPNATIAWTTIIQPNNTSPALYIKDDLTLTGVILGGDGDHCAFDNNNPALLSDAYTLANDDSCGQQGVRSRQNITLGLGPLTTTTINGVQQSYYPLLEDSPAVDGSLTNICPASDDPDVMNLDQLGTSRPQNTSCDIGAIESPFTGSDVLCANRWTGQLQYTPGCNRSSNPVLISSGDDLDLCVNTWNSATRLSDDCTRSEHPIAITPTQSIPICINTWNPTLRATDRCTRSETAGRL